MQRHDYRVEFDAPVELVWHALHPPVEQRHRSRGPDEPRVIEHGGVRIEVLYEGNEHGEGLVRHCWFRVPRWLLTRGQAQSWEIVDAVRPYEFAQYHAIGTPPRSKALGWQRFVDLGGGRSAIEFHEEYEVANPLLRRVVERRVHRFISADNDVLIKKAVEARLAHLRKEAPNP